MTHVVFLSCDYCLRIEFWQDSYDAGVPPHSVEIRNGQYVCRPVSPAEFVARTQSRVASWTYSADKSVSVFVHSLSPREKAKAILLFQQAVEKAVQNLADRFSARTGAQGKHRLAAELGFCVFIHAEAKNGSPQIHAHVTVDSRVRVPGNPRTYATHTRELYQLRKLFDAAVSHELGRGLLQEFGVRVVKTRYGIKLPDVPQTLCKRCSVRSQQIADFLVKYRYKSSRLSRSLAARATRRDIQDRFAGRVSFATDLIQAGFLGEQICSRIPIGRFAGNSQSQIKRAARLVGREAKRLALSKHAFTGNELLASALAKAKFQIPLPAIRLAVDTILQNPAAHGLRQETTEHGHILFKSDKPLEQ